MTAADVLAVIEPGPAALPTIAGWLKADERDVRRQLRQLRRQGLVKQVGQAHRWALASYTAHCGRSVEDGRDYATEVLALLTAGPLPSGRIAAAIGRSDTTVMKVLIPLERAGAVKRIGRSLHTRWALPSFEAPPLPPVKPKRPRQPKPARPTEVVETGGSWWTRHAAPGQRDSFIVAAHQRDVEMAEDATWQRRTAPRSYLSENRLRLPAKGML